jgi:hypothetical protein
MNNRVVGLSAFAFSVLGLWASLGCVAERGDTDVGPRYDVGTGWFDVPSSDVGPAIDVPATRAPSENRGLADFAGCLDGYDADGDTQIDCLDGECATAPVCCVGSTRAACCTAAAPSSVTLADCAGTACGATPAVIFGAPDLAGGLRGTSELADGGVVLGTPIDPRLGATEVRATVAAPTAPEALDWVAFGLTGAPGGSGRVLPVVAVQVNAALGRTSLVVGETIVATTPTALSGELSLRVDGGGTVSAGLAGMDPVLTATVVPRGAMYPAAYGRASGPAGMTITSLTVSHDVCDIPAALDLVAVDLVDEALAFVHGTEANPSLVRGPSGALFMAFDAVRVDAPDRRGIFLAEETEPGRFVVRNPSSFVPQPILGDVSSADQVIDPELGFATDHWELYVAGDTNGVRRILHARSAGMDPTFGPATPIDVDVAGYTSFDAPARFPGRSDRLLVRGTSPEATTIFQIDLSALDAGFEAAARLDGLCSVDDDCSRGRASTFVLESRPGSGLFDADEVDDPSLVVAGTVHRLYYAGRRANRWTLSVVVSEDGIYWRRISSTSMADDAVLGADAELAPLGVRSVSALAESDSLTVALEGWYGTRSRLLIARQSH